MAISSPPHLPTSPKAHPVAASHPGDGAVVAGAANEAVRLPDNAAALEAMVSTMPPSPSADNSSTQTRPVVLPTTPNHTPVTATHPGDGVGAAAAARQACLPPDTSADVAMRLSTNQRTIVSAPAAKGTMIHGRIWNRIAPPPPRYGGFMACRRKLDTVGAMLFASFG